MKNKFLILALITTFLPIENIRAEIASGTWENGEEGSGTWVIDDDGKLTVSGTGKIGNYDVQSFWSPPTTKAPWVGNYNNSVTSIEIEQGITDIGTSAFQGMKNATTITIPEGVERIGSNAFTSAWAMTDLYLPDSLKEIGNQAFYGCNRFTAIIPESVQTFGTEFVYQPIDVVLVIGENTQIPASSLSGARGDKGVEIYCLGDIEKCRQNVQGCSSVFSKCSFFAATKEIENGMVNIYDANGNLVTSASQRLSSAQNDTRQKRLIYTVEEAAKVSKNTGNKIMLRYK